MEVEGRNVKDSDTCGHTDPQVHMGTQAQECWG